MDQPKNVAEDFAVVRFLLEAHKFGVDPFETLVGLGQKLPQQVVHSNRLVRHARERRRTCLAPAPPDTRERVLWPPGAECRVI